MTNEKPEPTNEARTGGVRLSDGLGELTLEQIIEARDTKIAILQGALRAMTETADENNRIRVEDIATIRRYREALDLLLSPEPRSFLRIRFGATLAEVDRLLA